jgi:hypothetical protein
MGGLICNFKHNLTNRLLCYRNYPFLSATMAACALVDAVVGSGFK